MANIPINLDLYVCTLYMYMVTHFVGFIYIGKWKSMSKDFVLYSFFNKMKITVHQLFAANNLSQSKFTAKFTSKFITLLLKTIFHTNKMPMGLLCYCLYGEFWFWLIFYPLFQMNFYLPFRYWATARFIQKNSSYFNSRQMFSGELPVNL
jgi:hypothetical protein